MQTTTRAIWILCVAGVMLAGSATSQEASAPDNDAKARERYSKLMEHAEGRGRTCAIAQTSRERTLAALESFAKSAKFLDLDPGKPIRVVLPEEYYHPQGRTVTFDQFAIAINRKNVSDPYISITRTAEGVELQPKIALEIEDGRILCFRHISGTLKYRSPADLLPPKSVVGDARGAAAAERAAAVEYPGCPATLPRTEPMPSEYAGANFGNEFLLVSLWPKGTLEFAPGGAGVVLADGSLRMKFPWWRRVPGKLQITGRRLDQPAPPLRAEIPEGYGDTGFQAAALIFPSAGCWEITGRVNDAQLSFVTKVIHHQHQAPVQPQ